MPRVAGEVVINKLTQKPQRNRAGCVCVARSLFAPFGEDFMKLLGAFARAPLLV